MVSFYRIQPLMTRIRKAQLGGNNLNWVVVRFNVTKWMLIILGKLIDGKIIINNNGVYVH